MNVKKKPEKNNINTHTHKPEWDDCTKSRKNFRFASESWKLFSLQNFSNFIRHEIIHWKAVNRTVAKSKSWRRIE